MVQFSYSHFRKLQKVAYIAYAIFTLLISTLIIISHEFIRDQKIEGAAEHVDAALTAIFDNSEHLLKFLAKITSDNDDPHYIEHVLSSLKTDSTLQNMASWNYVSWITPEGFITITSRTGILNPPVKVNRQRPNVWEAIQTPNKAFIGQPDNGVISGQMIMPVTLGVANANGRVIGALHMTLMVSSIESKIKEAIGSDYKFIITDKQSKNIVLSSTNSPTTVLDTPFSSHDFRYVSVKTSTKYPFAIRIGYNHKLDSQILLLELTIFASVFLVIGICCSLGLKVFYKNALCPVQKLTAATGTALQKNDAKIMDAESFPEIRALADNFSAMMIARAEAEKARQHAEVESKTAQSSITAISDILTRYKQADILQTDNIPTDINVKSFLEECLNVYAYPFWQQQIQGKTETDITTVFRQDAFKLKLIILGFMSHIFETGLELDSLVLRSSNEILYGKNHLVLSITDNDLVRDSGLGTGNIVLDEVLEKRAIALSPSLLHAVRLIKHLQGFLTVKSVAGSGTTYVITIPENSEAGNVISFLEKREQRKNPTYDEIPH